jgi:MFS transporter, FSR family, fosmidomycin resistance protein
LSIKKGNPLAGTIRLTKPKFLNKVEPQTLKSIIVSSAHGIHDMYSGFSSPLLPFLIERLSLMKAEAGVFILVFQGVSILQPMIGHLSDRKNLRKYALIAPAITAIFISLVGVASTYWTVILFYLIAGISSATLHAILPALVSSFSGEKVGKGMSIWMIGGELGVMVGPLILTVVITIFSINATPWLMIIGILYSIILSLVLKDLPYHNKESKNGAVIPVKQLIAILLPITLITFLISPARSASLHYLPVFLQENGASVWFSGIVLSVMQGVGLIGTISGGILSDRIGYRVTMIIAIILSSIAMVVASLTTAIMQVVFFCILNLAVLMILPVGMALIQRSFPNNRSLANGLYLSIMFGINALASVFTGFLYDTIGGQPTFLFTGIAMILALPFVFLLPKTNSKAHEHIRRI